MNLKEKELLMEKLWLGTNTDRDCWEWQNGFGSHGYGQVYIPGGTPLLTHRVSWELIYGEIPSGLCVLHKCDNKKCVRPNHLFLGTHKDNVQDMFDKGRSNTFQPKGDANKNTKITDKQVVEIRLRCKIGTRQNPGNSKELAEEYGVTDSLVRQIKRGVARC